jgi:fermentation-respiration switch protein FrsA (DUF1100 family)
MKFTILLCILLLTGCSSFLYYPTRYEHVRRERLPVKPEDIEFTSEDGTKLHGWYFHAPASTRRNCTIVFFHGNAQNLTTHFLTLLSAPPRGYDYFIFDYRGYGSSEDKPPSPATTAADGRSAIRWVKKYDPKQNLIIFGQSLGGAVALRSTIDLLSEVKPKAVIVDSTFSSYQAVGRSVLSKSWITWLLQPLPYLLLSDRYAPESDLPKLSPIPLLVIHGDQDQTVDFKMGERVFAHAVEPKEFWRVENGHHTDFMWHTEPGDPAGKYAKKFYEYLDQKCE